MNRPEGCKIEAMNDEACRLVIEWITGGGGPAQDGSGLTWLLAHCRDGVTWGRIDGTGRHWRLSSSPFSDLCPGISQTNLLEMRLFGPDEEIMVWWAEEGFLGRRLIDEPKRNRDTQTRFTEPYDEIRIMLGDRLMDGPKEGFTRVMTADGRQQAVPLECTDDDFKDARWPLRLKVRHYFEQDPETGVVRVAASRLVNIFKEVH